MNNSLPIIFPVTYRCNLSCSYCREYKKKDITDINKSIEMIKSMSNEWVYLTGGEPLILDEIYNICNALKLAGKKVGLTTNGTIHKFGIVSYVDRLGISLDGPKDINDLTRGEGSFDKSIKFLEKVAGKTEVGIMCTVGNWNENRLNEIEEIGKQYKCDFIQFSDVN